MTAQFKPLAKTSVNSTSHRCECGNNIATSGSIFGNGKTLSGWMCVAIKMVANMCENGAIECWMEKENWILLNRANLLAYFSVGQLYLVYSVHLVSNRGIIAIVSMKQRQRCRWLRQWITETCFFFRWKTNHREHTIFVLFWNGKTMCVCLYDTSRSARSFMNYGKFMDLGCVSNIELIKYDRKKITSLLPLVVLLSTRSHIDWEVWGIGTETKGIFFSSHKQQQQQQKWRE